MNDNDLMIGMRYLNVPVDMQKRGLAGRALSKKSSEERRRESTLKLVEKG
jgi:hypothetical protein